MSFSHIAENRIRKAIAEGEFDNLSNAGQPLNLEEYFRAPADLRMAYSILKNANCAPVEVEFMRDMSRLKHAIADTQDPVERGTLQRTLAERQMRLAMALERRPSGDR
jgi:hypothetical protein